MPGLITNGLRPIIRGLPCTPLLARTISTVRYAASIPFCIFSSLKPFQSYRTNLYSKPTRRSLSKVLSFPSPALARTHLRCPAPLLSRSMAQVADPPVPPPQPQAPVSPPTPLPPSPPKVTKPDKPIAPKEPSAEPVVHLTVAEQRKADWRIVKKLVGHLWPAGKWGVKGRVILALSLLLAGKARPLKSSFPMPEMTAKHLNKSSRSSTFKFPSSSRMSSTH